MFVTDAWLSSIHGGITKVATIAVDPAGTAYNRCRPRITVCDRAVWMSTERQHDFHDFELSDRGLQLAVSFSQFIFLCHFGMKNWLESKTGECRYLS